MTELPLETRRYLAPPTPTFWVWDENEVVITTLDQRTVAFGEELECIFRAEESRGLPPLSLLALVLAYCRDWAADVEVRAAALAPELLARCFQRSPATTLDQLRIGLEKIASFPPDLRHPVESKITLINFLFEDCPVRTSPALATEVCETLRFGRSDMMNRLAASPGGDERLHRAIVALVGALQRLEQETLRRRQETGLGVLPEAAALELDLESSVANPLANLPPDDRLYGLSKVVRALAAVIHLPRPLADSEELPFGGFSDITNRGSLDRLLVSELAHDDLTLSVRIALNETLYLRRENPRKAPPLARAVLLDVGIRQWGVSRVFATAVALAIAATAHSGIRVATFLARGSHVREVSFRTRRELENVMKVLETDAHPGAALEEFIAVTRAPSGSVVDRIVITHSDTFADPEFQECLHIGSKVPLYVATVDASGRFQLREIAAHRQRIVCAAHIDLADLLPRPQEVYDSRAAEGKPSLFGITQFPFRIPNGEGFRQERSWFVVGVGVFEITRNRRLLLWDEAKRGPRQVADYVRYDMPICWNNPLADAGRVVAVLGTMAPGKRYLLTVDLAAKQVNYFPLLPDETLQSLSVAQGVLLALTDEEIIAVSTTDGQLLARRNYRSLHILPAAHSQRLGRYLLDFNTITWYAATFDGIDIGLELVFNLRLEPSVSVALVFDHVDGDGQMRPLGITDRMELVSLEERRLYPLVPHHMVTSDTRIDIEAISPAGRWLCSRQWQGTTEVFQCYSILDRTSAPVETSGDEIKFLEYEPRCKLSSNVICHATAIGVVDHVDLALLTRGNVWRQITLDHETGRLRLQPLAETAGQGRAERTGQVVSFGHGKRVGAQGYSLSIARWPDGSEAVFDSRGLLHLRSAAGGIPEVGLVLDVRTVSGACSDGRCWGNPYYLLGEPNASDDTIYAEVLCPFVRQLPL